MTPRKLRMFLSFILLLLPALSHASVINYTYTQVVSTPYGWDSTYGNSNYHLTYTFNTVTQQLNLTSLGIGTFDLYSSGGFSYTCQSQTCNYNYDTTTSTLSSGLTWAVYNYFSTPSNLGTISTSSVVDQLSFFNAYTETSKTLAINGTPSVLPVPAPPSWLMMLTGLGILIPLYRRHVKAQHNSDVGGDQNLTV